MIDEAPGLYLLTPVLGQDAEAFLPLLDQVCRAGRPDAVLLRLAATDDRTVVGRIKALAPVVQESGAALLVEFDGENDVVSAALRGGADGVHADSGWRELRGRLKEGRVLGAGGLLSRDDAMAAGEGGADYLMFGEPGRDGSLPDLEEVAELAAWWAEIFEPPCVAFAATAQAVGPMARTGAEFIAVADAVWTHPGGPVAGIEAVRALATAANKVSA